MPNIKSAKKRVLVASKKTLRNQMLKTALKTAIKKFETLAAEKKVEEAKAAYKQAVKKIDMSVTKGILHKNTAARKKSALTLKLNKIG